jgi:hypothetical protein
MSPEEQRKGVWFFVSDVYVTLAISEDKNPMVKEKKEGKCVERLRKSKLNKP